VIGMNHDTLRFPCLIPGAQAPVRVPWGGAPYGTAAGKDSLTDFEKPFQQVFSPLLQPAIRPNLSQSPALSKPSWKRVPPVAGANSWPRSLKDMPRFRRKAAVNSLPPKPNKRSCFSLIS